MPKPRKRLVSLADTPYYHCIARCVRRAFLCGKDPVTGFDFEHRRAWIVDRMMELSAIFAMDICAYAVMSNHYHIVLRVRVRQAQRWTDQEVAERWTQIFSGPLLVQRWQAGAELAAFELEQVQMILDEWRERLANLSWYMRCLNEFIARLANREDHCRGRFWEGRFQSQALLDERAVLSCMAYVDLNPIRAALATTPEGSDFTSIQQRIRDPQTTTLLRFTGHHNDVGIAYQLEDYLDLVDWAGRAIRSDKKGHIADTTPPVLQRLNLDGRPLLGYLSGQQKANGHALGPVSRMRALAASFGLRFIKGISLSKTLCPEPG